MEELTVRILVCDDQNAQSIMDAAKAADIGKLHDIREADLPKELEALFELANTVFSPESSHDATNSTGFDDYDLILLDFGLTELDRFSHRLTAEHVAGYIRALTSAGYVVSLNKLPNVDFDLKYLLGDFDTTADLALNTNLLSQKGLWDGSPEQGEFCPWYWPRLNGAAARRKKQIEIVKANIDKPILKTFNFPDEVIKQLSLQAIAFLSPLVEETGTDCDIKDVTFWHQFCHSNRTLHKADRFGLLGKINGGELPLEAPKCERIRGVVARVVAGELDFWFRRDILGPQRLLIDAPHLQMKYRFRPNENGAPILDEWSKTASEWTRPYGLDTVFFNTLETAEFKQLESDQDMIWTDKPCFWHPLIESTTAFQDLAERYQKRQHGIVFCQDTRRFVARDSARRFETGIGRGIDIRYIEKKEEYNYSPASQLAW